MLSYDALTVDLDAVDLREAMTGLVQDSGIRPHTEYQHDPIGWAVDKLGVAWESLVWSDAPGYGEHEWDGTPDPLGRVLWEIAEGRDVGVESGTGTGKTFLGAVIVLWFLACFEDSIVVTVAPKEAQLKLHIWKEIGRLFPAFQRHFPTASLIDGKLRMRDAVEDRETWAATAFVAGVGADERSATKAQGFHAEHMLIVIEETPGMNPAIMTALENTCTAPHNLRLAFGNPDHQSDPLHQFCTSPGVVHVRISALDHPNVVTGDASLVPGAVSGAAVERRRILYAHTPAMYESRVRGISPRQAHGIVLHCYDEARHWVEMSPTEWNERLLSREWRFFGGIDFGAWRFAFVLGVVDEEGRVLIVERVFSQQETLADRATRIHNRLWARGIRHSFPIDGDAANPQDIMEINRAFRHIESPFRCRAVAMEAKGRLAAVERLNDLLHRDVLRFARHPSDDSEWRHGLDASSNGTPMVESRLAWELRHWRYPPPKEEQAQKQDPDDHTADGSDMIAALRYAIMGSLKAAKAYEPEQRVPPDEDRGLERVMDLKSKAARAEARAFKKALKAAGVGRRKRRM